MSRWLDCAILKKKKNLKGRFVAYSAANLPLLFAPETLVHFVPPALDAPRSAAVTLVRPAGGEGDNSNYYEVEFASIEDPTIMDAMLGMHCLVSADGLTDEALAAAVPETWVGFTVEDEALGPLGSVAEILERPGQDLLIVQNDQGKEIQIPKVDEFIFSVDSAAKTLRVSIPKGLLEL